MKPCRILVLLVGLALISLDGYSHNRTSMPDSLLNNTILSVELVKDSCGTGFFVKNELADTILLRSSFFIDDPVKASHILVYYCLHDKNMATKGCDYGYATSTSDAPVILEFYNRKVVLPPKKTIYFPMSIPCYSHSSVYLRLQLILMQKNKLWYVQKTTNSIQL